MVLDDGFALESGDTEDVAMNKSDCNGFQRLDLLGV
jgi:hypothetical protein